MATSLLSLSNEFLCDVLFSKGKLTDERILEAFKNTDRGDFFGDIENRSHAYFDHAMKRGHIHVSAPHMYATVLKGLELSQGQSFLNVGSGSGYFSCLVAHMVGPTGLCHGIDTNLDVVAHSRLCCDKWIEKLAQQFKENVSTDQFVDKCAEENQNFDMLRDSISFVHGNCFHIDTAQCTKYDRIYVGAGCPDSHKEFFYGMLQVGGILVVPVIETSKLVKVRRVAETVFVVEAISSAWYTPLQSNEDTEECVAAAVQSLVVNRTVNDTLLKLLNRNADVASMIDMTSVDNLVHLCAFDHCHNSPASTMKAQETQDVATTIGAENQQHTMKRARISLPTTSWYPFKIRHLQFPVTFRKAVITLLLCARHGDSQRGPSTLPSQLWMNILSYCTRDWFELPVTATELLLHELLVERKLRRQAEMQLEAAEKARKAAEKERDFLRSVM